MGRYRQIFSSIHWNSGHKPGKGRQVEARQINVAALTSGNDAGNAAVLERKEPGWPRVPPRQEAWCVERSPS